MPSLIDVIKKKMKDDIDTGHDRRFRPPIDSKTRENRYDQRFRPPVEVTNDPRTRDNRNVQNSRPPIKVVGNPRTRENTHVQNSHPPITTAGDSKTRGDRYDKQRFHPPIRVVDDSKPNEYNNDRKDYPSSDAADDSKTKEHSRYNRNIPTPTELLDNSKTDKDSDIVSFRQVLTSLDDPPKNESSKYDRRYPPPLKLPDDSQKEDDLGNDRNHTPVFKSSVDSQKKGSLRYDDIYQVPVELPNNPLGENVNLSTHSQYHEPNLPKLGREHEILNGSRKLNGQPSDGPNPKITPEPWPSFDDSKISISPSLPASERLGVLNAGTDHLQDIEVDRKSYLMGSSSGSFADPRKQHPSESTSHRSRPDRPVSLSSTVHGANELASRYEEYRNPDSKQVLYDVFAGQSEPLQAIDRQLSEATRREKKEKINSDALLNKTKELEDQLNRMKAENQQLKADFYQNETRSKDTLAVWVTKYTDLEKDLAKAEVGRRRADDNANRWRVHSDQTMEKQSLAVKEATRAREDARNTTFNVTNHTIEIQMRAAELEKMREKLTEVEQDLSEALNQISDNSRLRQEIVTAEYANEVLSKKLQTAELALEYAIQDASRQRKEVEEDFLSELKLMRSRHSDEVNQLHNAHEHHIKRYQTEIDNVIKHGRQDADETVTRQRLKYEAQMKQMRKQHDKESLDRTERLNQVGKTVEKLELERHHKAKLLDQSVADNMRLRSELEELSQKVRIRRDTDDDSSEVFCSSKDLQSRLLQLYTSIDDWASTWGHQNFHLNGWSRPKVDRFCLHLSHFVRFTTPMELPTAVIEVPILLLSAALAHRIDLEFFNAPFFCLESGQAKTMTAIYSSLQDDSYVQAVNWRASTWQILSSSSMEDESADTKSRRHVSNLCDAIATSFMISPAGCLGKPLYFETDLAQRAESLRKILLNAAGIARCLWLRKAFVWTLNLSTFIERGLKFEIASPLMQAHPIHQIDPQDSSNNGRNILIMTRPVIALSDADEKGHPRAADNELEVLSPAIAYLE